MKEIGGYLGLEYFSGEEYHQGLVALNNGRNALACLLKARNIERLYIPYFLCNSVSDVCGREGVAVSYYSIDRHFHPVFDRKLAKHEYLYIVNYYGQITNEQIIAWKEEYKNVIVDNVQSFFQRPVNGVDTVYSCRKFFGVPDGGYLSTDISVTDQLEKDVSKDRMKHILGRFEGCASDYYSDFKANDRSFVDLPPRKMSDLTHNLLRAVDYDGARNRRNDNFRILDLALAQYNALELRFPDGPYCYPFYCENGMELKKQLAEKKIYIATLWPNVLKMQDTLAKDFSENILPIPCDQRYDKNDMLRIIEEVMKCIS
jgi:hypothetical protein